MEELIAAKSIAQAARAEDLMARIRAIELYRIQKHLDEQFKYIYDKIDENAPTEEGFQNEEQRLQCVIDDSVYRTDYDNSLIDIVQKEIQEEKGYNPLKSENMMSYARFMYHRSERKRVKECANVISEVIGNALPDNAETESSSDDETEKEAFLYKSVEKNKIRQYRPIATTPIAKWAKFRSQFISSWSWLDHAVADTEFRLKKTDALYSQMRRAKPAFTLDSPQPSSSSSISLQVKDIEGITVFNNPDETPAINFRFGNDSNVSEVKKREEKASSSTAVSPSPSPPKSSVSNALYQGFDCPASLSVLADVSVNQEYLPRDSVEEMAKKVQQARPTEKINQTMQLSSNEAEEDATQVASRCRALKSWKPRKIFQMHGISHFMNDVVESVRHADCQCQLGEACLLCLGDKYKDVPESPSSSFREKAALLYPCFHKSLSTTDEIPTEMLMYKTLEELEDNGEHEEMGIFRQFVSTGPFEGQRYALSQEEMEDLEESPFEVTTKRGRGRPRSRNLLSPDFSSESDAYGSPKKSQQSSRGRKPRKQYVRRRRRSAADTDDTDDEPSDRSIPNSSAAAFKRLNSRRRPDFDIDNIVIPSHISANTRVEKLEYKEIITPSYREVKIEPIQSDRHDLRPPKKTGIKRERRFMKKINDDYEDLDEETIIARHGRCEEEERRKFSSVINKNTIRRRRLKSKSESSDPGTPVSESVEVNDPGSPPNTAHTSTSDNCINNESHLQVMTSEDASMAATALKVGPGRRRTISASKKEEEEIEECLIAPFPRRRFPLPQDEYTVMQDFMPEGHVQ